MNDLATARAAFLAKVEDYASGQSSRFAPALDELIEWSNQNGLQFTPHSGMHNIVKFSIVGTKTAFWAVTPRTLDGAKLTLLNDLKFAESLRVEAREELCQIDGKVPTSKGIPEVAFTKLNWAPYRARVIDLMGRLLEGIRQPKTENVLAEVAG